MGEYWQDKRINPKRVACAWGLALLVMAMMVVVTSFTAGDCPPSRDVTAASCVDDVAVGEANVPVRQSALGGG